MDTPDKASDSAHNRTIDSETLSHNLDVSLDLSFYNNVLHTVPVNSKNHIDNPTVTGEPLKGHRTSIFYQNANSIRNKCNKFYLNVLSEDYDIIIITETNLIPEISDSELFDFRYKIYRQDRDLTNTNKLSGGGIIVAIKYSIEGSKIEKLNENNHDLETLWLKCIISGHIIYLCACYFSPPNKHTTLKKFTDSLTSHPDMMEQKMLIIGDFNIPEYAFPELGEKSSTVKELNQLINLFNFESHNPIKNHMDRILDLCLSNLSKFNASRKKYFSIEVEKDQGLVEPDKNHPPLAINILMKKK